MDRVDAPGNLNGLFTDGNPVSGQQATQVRAKWLNDVQENLMYLIEQAALTPESGDYTLISQAISLLVAGIVGDGSGAVPTTRQILTSGLASGGGNLGLDRTISVAKASAAEVAAGVRDDVAITPLGLIGGVGARVLAGSGYATFMGGVILQWIPASVVANGSTNVTLPTTFPNQCVFADFSGGIATDAQDNDPTVSNKSVSAVTVYSARDGGANGWVFAIGF